MENSEFNPHASILSRSALHAYITGPGSQQPQPKSNFNPYRKRQGILTLMSLKQVERALEASLEAEPETEEIQPLSTAPLSLSGSALPT
ncbi:MAG: hypothetical protein NTX25_04615 [Proteobacteria bacterium]|nr:hypothetical protein [Pseudomonadota bacterium]